ALVKGITPAQPAPGAGVAPAAETPVAPAAPRGLFSRLIGWLTGSTGAQQSQAEAAAEFTEKPSQTGRRKSARSGDRRERGSDERPRSRRGERRGESGRSTEAAEGVQTRGQRRGPGGRGKAAPEQDRSDTPIAAESSEVTESTSSRSGRGRRGRGRYRREEGIDTATDASTLATAATTEGEADIAVETPAEAVPAEDTSLTEAVSGTDTNAEQADPERKRRRRRS